MTYQRSVDKFLFFYVFASVVFDGHAAKNDDLMGEVSLPNQRVLKVKNIGKIKRRQFGVV